MKAVQWQIKKMKVIEHVKVENTLYREGKLLMSLTRKHRPIIVAILQCSTVGVNVILMKNPVTIQ